MGYVIIILNVFNIILSFVIIWLLLYKSYINLRGSDDMEDNSIEQPDINEILESVEEMENAEIIENLEPVKEIIYADPPDESLEYVRKSEIVENTGELQIVEETENNGEIESNEQMDNIENIEIIEKIQPTKQVENTDPEITLNDITEGALNHNRLNKFFNQSDVLEVVGNNQVSRRRKLALKVSGINNTNK